MREVGWVLSSLAERGAKNSIEGLVSEAVGHQARSISQQVNMSASMSNHILWWWAYLAARETIEREYEEHTI